jgi:hypothetical protein
MFEKYILANSNTECKDDNSEEFSFTFTYIHVLCC